MENNNVFKFFLCTENGMALRFEDGGIQTVCIYANDIEEALEKFSLLFPNCFWDIYEEFEDK